MVMRKGLGKNRGMGYKNLIPKYDSNRHSLNARGYKMPQRVPMMQCGGKDQFSKLRGKQVIIKAKRWFDKVNGNTYHSVVVYVDGKIIGENPFAYGYDEAYLQTAHKILQSKGYVPNTKERLNSGMDADYYNWQMFNREHRDKLLTFVDDVSRQKDLGGKWAHPPLVPNMEEAEHLELYIDNDYELHKERAEPIINNLVKKKKKGIYDHDKAVKSFMNLADAGAKKFKKENPEEEAGYNKATRMKTAESMAKYFEDEYELGNFE